LETYSGETLTPFKREFFMDGFDDGETY